MSKDAIKERLFDSLGWNDREWSKKLGAASYDLLYSLVETLLSTGVSIIVESNFDALHAAQTLAELRHRCSFEVLQIACFANGEVLSKRFRERAESGARHPGHLEHLQYEEQGSILQKGRSERIEIEGAFIEVDTSHFEMIDWDSLLRLVRDELKEST